MSVSGLKKRPLELHIHFRSNNISIKMLGKLLYTHIVWLKHTSKIQKYPSAVNCRGSKPAAVNSRGKPRQLTADVLLLQIWQKLSHPLLLSFYQKISNLSQNLYKKPNQILPNLFNKITSK